MHSGMPGHYGEKPSRRDVWRARAHRALRFTRRQFLRSATSAAGTACINAAVLWIQHRR
jgi:hypothetical protein